MLKEFKEFALKGNVLDLAIGVMIALALSGVVKSLIQDIIMPIIGLIFGKPNFDDIKIGEHIEIGKFLTEVVNFLIIAGVLFLLVKAVNTLLGTKMGHNHEEGMDELKDHVKESFKE